MPARPAGQRSAPPPFPLRCLLFVCLLWAAAIPGCGRGEAPSSFQPPGIESWTGEPQVSAKLRVLRGEALEAPESAAAVGRLGMAFHAHELHAEAVACYRRAMELAPEEARWPHLAALGTAETDLAASVELSALAASRPDAGAAVHLQHGDALLRLGRGGEAAAAYRRALEADPASAHARYGLAQAAGAAGDLAEAADLLAEATRLEPRHAEAHGLRAQVLRRLGRDKEAGLALLRAGALPPTRPPDPHAAAMEAEAVSSQAFTRRGRALAEAGRYAEAEAAFRRVLAIRAGTARDHSNLGAALAGQGELVAAVAEFEKALAIDPEETYSLNNLALALAGRGDLAGAAARLERAVALDPAYAEAHHNLGLVRARQGRLGEAVGHYRDALAAEPARVGALNDLASALAANGALAEAEEHWRRALAIDPSELSALHNLSLALVQRGEHAEAVRWLRRGLGTAPNSSRLALLLAWELATAPDAAVRDPAEAEALARRVLDAYPRQPQAADTLAAALAAQGRFDLAVPVAERALAAAQTTGETSLAPQIAARLALYRRGEAYRQVR